MSARGAQIYSPQASCWLKVYFIRAATRAAASCQDTETTALPGVAAVAGCPHFPPLWPPLCLPAICSTHKLARGSIKQKSYVLYMDKVRSCAAIRKKFNRLDFNIPDFPPFLAASREQKVLILILILWLRCRRSFLCAVFGDCKPKLTWQNPEKG